MSVFIFRILPILALVALGAGITFTAVSVTRGGRKNRVIGMVSIALFVVLLAAWLLLGLARL